VRVAELTEVDLVLTDDGLPDELAAPFGEAVQRVKVPAGPPGPGENGRKPESAG
jgi:hypothetical protein